MHKFTPESFAAVQIRRITTEIQAYTKPERLALLAAVGESAETLYNDISDSMQREGAPPADPDQETPQPVPSSDSGSETSGGTGTEPEPSSTPGAEATSAPGEPGAVPPDSDPDRARETQTIAPGDVGDIGSVLGTPPG